MMKRFRLPDPPPNMRARVLEGATDPGNATHLTAGESSSRLGALLVVGACLLMAGVLWIILAASWGRQVSPTKQEHAPILPAAGDALVNAGQDFKEKSPPDRALSNEAKERLLKNVESSAEALRHTAAQTKAPDAVKCRVRRVDDGSQYLVEVKLLAGDRVLQEPTVALSPGQWSTTWIGEKAKAWTLESKKDGEPAVAEVEIIGSGSAMIVRCEPAKNGRIDVQLRTFTFADHVMTWSLREDFQLASGEEQTLKKRITLNARDLEIREVIRMIERASGKTIVVAPDVKGTITVSVNNVPWDDTLSAIVKTLNHRVVSEKDGTLRVVTSQEK